MTMQELNEKLTSIIASRSAAQEAMEGLYQKAVEENRDLTDEENTAFDGHANDIERLKGEEARVRGLMENRQELDAPARPFTNAIVPNPLPDEFRSFGEFVSAIRFNPNDHRLNFVEMETREQSMGVGTEGGFAVPTQFVPTLLQVDPQTAIFRPRANVIPAGTPPDASISMPALNQTAAENMYGGVTVEWIEEGGTKPETDAALLEVTLQPHEVAGHTVISDKLLRNWAAADALLTRLLRSAIIASEDTAFLNGSGVGRPLGITNSPATINVARNTANAIDYVNDIINMFSRAKFGGTFVWIGSQTILPQLMGMTDSGGSTLVWAPGQTGLAASGPPGTLCGIPLIFNDRSPGLGTAGDLMLVDLSYYLIKDGSGPFVATSPHVHFTTNKTVIKAFWNVDGAPWLSGPIPLEGSTANTVSPFIVLN
jgi:HK97 family phage major capsid protein